MENELTEDELKAVGARVVEWFGLKKDAEHKDRYVTELGTKTLVGLGRVAFRLTNERSKK
jgi:hypothetical protein